MGGDHGHARRLDGPGRWGGQTAVHAPGHDIHHVQANGAGFLPGERVVGLLESTPVDLGARTADVGGNVVFTVTLATDIAAGTHRITLTGTGSGAVVAEFQVEVVGAAPPSAPAPDVPHLPGTGVAGLPVLAGLALLLMALGALLGRAGRRREGGETPGR